MANFYQNKQTDLKRILPDSALLSNICQMEVTLFGEGAASLWFLHPFSHTGYMYVFLVEECPAGYCIFLPMIEDKNSLWLFSFGILPEYQNSGYGSVFLQKIRPVLIESGYDSVELTVAPENIAAQKLYSKILGPPIFSHLRENCYGSGEHRLHQKFSLI
jgi:ribosomal-protein-alanine N-acetyltransferase